MDKETGMELSILRMEDITKESGKTIKCTALENCTTKTEKQPMKDTGRTTNSTGKDVSTTPTPAQWTKTSTTKIFPSQETVGFTTRDSSKTTQSTGRGT